MLDNRRITVITPAGRKRHLDILAVYVFANRPLVDHWMLWVNTANPDDVDECERLRRLDPGFVSLVHHDTPITRPMPQPPFFRTAVDPDTVYIKLDDDICYVHPEAVANLVRFRLENPDPTIVYANTVGNSFCGYIHKKFGAQDFLIEGKYRHITAEFSNLIWHDVPTIESVHRSFLRDLVNADLEKYLFSSWILDRYERVAIQAICWLGRDFAEFSGIIDHIDEEEWLSCIRPRQVKRANVICGDALVTHFASYRHRKPFCVGREIDPRFLRAYGSLAQYHHGDICKQIWEKSVSNPPSPGDVLRLLDSRVIL